MIAERALPITTDELELQCTLLCRSVQQKFLFDTFASRSYNQALTWEENVLANMTGGDCFFLCEMLKRYLEQLHFLPTKACTIAICPSFVKPEDSTSIPFHSAVVVTLQSPTEITRLYLDVGLHVPFALRVTTTTTKMPMSKHSDLFFPRCSFRNTSVEINLLSEYFEIYKSGDKAPFAK